MMRKLPTSLNAGALLLALMLAVIIAVVTAGLLLLLQYHRQYGAHTLQRERLQQKRQITSALTYPCIVMLTSMGAIFFMMNFIVPMFADIFQRSKGPSHKSASI